MTLLRYLCTILLFVGYFKPYDVVAQMPPIAHAGGGVEGKSYTNSIEALNHNYASGFDLFEIDFVWTIDNQLVCLHDWAKTPKWLLNYNSEVPLALKEFNQLEHPKLKFKPCNLQRLNQWLIDHPEALIVTDIKQNNINGLKFIKQWISDAEARIIPQIYQPEEYSAIKKMGYWSIIWSLYKYHGSNESVVRASQKMDLFAITMPEFRAKQGLAHALSDPYVPTYVHTINDKSTALYYQKHHGISSVYTDFLGIDFDILSVDNDVKAVDP